MIWWVKLFKDYNTPETAQSYLAPPRICTRTVSRSQEISFAPPEDSYKPLSVVEYDLSDIFVMNTDRDIVTVTELFKAKSTFIASLERSNIDNLINISKRINNQGNSVCKTRIQVKGEIQFILTLKAKYENFVSLIENFETLGPETNINQVFTILRAIIRAVREFKDFQNDFD